MENVRMDRFFSKLDLRDIKIKPEGSRFLPDDDEAETNEEPIAGSDTAEEAFNGHLDQTESATYESRSASTSGGTATYERVEVETWKSTAVLEEERRPSLHHRDESHCEVLKVSSKSRPSAVAGAIAGVVRENGRAEVQAIGAGATNQAIKAVAIAREYLLETEIDAICVPAFIDVTIDDEERTAIRLVVEKR